VCPGFSVNFDDLNEIVFGRVPENTLLGNFIRCYIGRSSDEKIVMNSSSGGLVTSLLVFLLEKKIIDGALVTRMNQHKPLEPEAIIATTKKEIESASQSKYCPVPANTAIQEIAKRNGHFAVVGLPCHIQGMRKAEALNPKLKEKIVVHLGLFCGHSVNFLGTEFILKKLAIEKSHVKSIDYRRFNFPGLMSIKLANGDEKSISHLDFWRSLFSISSFFAPMRCTLCGDATAEFADISFGTAWLPELKGDKNSICLSRTGIGEKLVQNAKREKRILTKEIDCDKIIEAEKQIIDFTKRKLKARLQVTRMLGQQTPGYTGLKLEEPSFDDYLAALMLYFRIYLSSRRSMWRFLSRATPRIKAAEPTPYFNNAIIGFKRSTSACAADAGKARGITDFLSHDV
jgi:coenzyme F420 hydrogenase subunit beta